jgi:hypothetical protein
MHKSTHVGARWGYSEYHQAMRCDPIPIPPAVAQALGADGRGAALGAKTEASALKPTNADQGRRTHRRRSHRSRRARWLAHDRAGTVQV